MAYYKMFCISLNQIHTLNGKKSKKCVYLHTGLKCGLDLKYKVTLVLPLK